jgi:hypothetical protein
MEAVMGFFKTKTAAEKLEGKWLALLKEARDIQRKGDIPAFARKSAEAEAIRAQLEELKAGSSS